MESLFWLVIVPSLVFCFILYYRRLQSKKISKVEPTEWPIVGHLCSMIANISHFHDWATAVLASTSYNFKLRVGLIGPQYLYTCDPSNVRHILTSNFANYPKGPEFEEIFDMLGGGIFNADGESWHRQRTKYQVAMMNPRFRAFSAGYSRDKVEKSLLPFLAHAAAYGTRCDLQDVFLRLTFDITCNLVFGVDPGCLQIGLPIVPIACALDDAVETVFLRHVIAPSFWKLMFRWEIGTEKKYAAAWRRIDCFAAEAIAATRCKAAAAAAADPHKTTSDVSADLLSSFISSSHSHSGNDDEFLRDTTVNLLFAGRDTTGTALTWFFYLLSSNPRVENKILEELATVVSCRRDPPHGDMVVFDASELSGLVYLHAAMCECLRLYPPVPMNHKMVVASDMLPSGHVVEPGDKIIIFHYSMARMEGIWGKDCLEFKPERWVNKDGSLRYEPPYKFIAFNAGSRTCLGKDLAFVQMKVTAAAMLWNFAMELVPGHVVEPKPSVVLHMKNGLEVTIKMRN